EVPLSGYVMAPLRKASNLRTAATSVVVEESEVIRITTDNSRQWKYQVESDRFPVNPGDLLQISYDITTDEGEMIALDLVGSTGNWLLGSS
ncbi:MAG: hypothetical protein JNJ47_08235, partial [Alphaproteobacteria bacterium]|nr:hypothetical protein [Alphaproteobacteria bacterium]